MDISKRKENIQTHWGKFSLLATIGILQIFKV